MIRLKPPVVHLCRLTTLVVSLWPALVFASLQSGLAHYEAGRYESAYLAFRHAAERGDHQAQLNIGVMYLKGQHVERDLVEGYAWMALSAQSAPLSENGTHEQVLSLLSDAQRTVAVARQRTLEKSFGDEALLQKMQPAFAESEPPNPHYAPVYTYPPQYPRSAALRGEEGWAEFIFSIEKDGTTSDHLVYYSSHSSFVEAALESLRRFRYEPVTVDGTPVTVHGVSYRFLFQLDINGADNQRRGVIADSHLTKLRLQAEGGAAQDQYLFAYLSQVAQSYVGEEHLSQSNRSNPNEWLMKAARQGHGDARFSLGRNTLYGDACEIDRQKSYYWLWQSANKGVVGAQYLLALELFSGAHFTQDSEQALFWLREAAKQHPTSRLRYVWVLSTHPDEEVRDGTLAHSLWSSVDERYFDRQRYYMTAAAVAAEQGNFKQAVLWQEKVIEDAQVLQLPLTQREAQLAMYEAGKPLREMP